MSPSHDARAAISDDVMRRALAAAISAPDVREDRVRAARARLQGGLPDSHQLADRIFTSVVSDLVR